MDDYMQHPGKVIKQNNKYYFQTVLNNASFWKEYKFYNANNQELATTVVNDNKKADTRTINVAVEPGYKSLTTKVHIVVPQINYNHRYTTHLEFEKAIPTLADAANQTMLNRFNQNQLNLKHLLSKLNQFNLKLKKLNLL